jgi:hypothetical protein
MSPGKMKTARHSNVIAAKAPSTARLPESDAEVVGCGIGTGAMLS